MSFKRALRVLFCGLLGLFRTLTTLGWRVLSKLRLRYTRRIIMSGDECEFDSTWEDGHENKTPRKKMFHSHGGSRRNMFAAKDMQAFRHSFRGLDNISDDDDGAGEQDKGHFYNLEFYRGKLRSSPDELYINDFHQMWFGEYDLLEDVHSYIQWLFPIQEPGVNWRAHVLSKKEIKLFRKDKEAKSKLVQSYKLMLDFYGICLVDESTGEVARAPNWKDRFRNLDRHTHNNLRITRILKCLGTLGLKHYQAPLVKFFLNETLVMGQLQNVKQSVLDYFMFAVLDKSERRELVKFAFKHFKPREHFVWGPRKILSGQVAHCKNKNLDQPTENNSSSAEDQQKMVNLHESKHKMNKIDASHPPKEMQGKKDHHNKDEPVIPNKLTETNSENENEGVVKKKNQDLSVGVSDGDDNENVAPANKSHGHGAVSGSHQTEEKRKKDHQNKDEPVIPNKLTETNQRANKSRPCSSDNGDVVKQNHEMSDGDGVSDNNENIAPANKSHGHDAFVGSHQTKEGSSCQVHDVEIKEIKDETEDKESDDNHKSLNPHESKHEIEKIEASHSPEEMKSKNDHQNKNEPVIPNKLTETNGDQRANKSRQCSSDNGDVVKQNHEMSVGVGDGVGDGDGVSDNNENIAPANKSHGHDAFVGSHQTKEGSSCQVHDVEMKDETEDKESEDNHKRLNPHESKHEIEKIEASHSPEEMKSKKDHQNNNEPVIPNKLTEINSVSVSDDNENTAPANMSHGHDAASGSHQTKEGSSCQVHNIEIKD
ncbi:opioid growth factor receptor-like isoform X2 [Sinocyclocheilus rhinocerous]|uniref:opioid growth factor receptor-like isoform X2 n=1 Tax=Sinocyclocheilus rhinocerous TaxID=307959 RepID=UPI0007B82E68|nr:PREDICTED: opioid growth factor receptor-like isoform X2 [Sinocyclocheilus rhinocerous]